ncbi:glycosyltransferase family 25 protein [Pantoea agglomerans]|uniref:Glycosyltransferase family 25 protein n=1 Tax=Enterobacter agglomerans TaxID=549 RepID=A0ACC5PVE9_ENTAG|nr:glycosyltransferase family 25 protein [Pantoea agglomerans]MBD8129236.1 glycosyltransferase family 25 protein [Pantoea agglomerans]MBD8156424.1 glycosyltransferase family 25 protein [Pantoea agglomerans]WVL84649.1 glycosyltransferase family 25 protein [Pantoea agglomerans]
MKVFVINLARSTERRASMEQQLSLLNLDYEIVEAVDGSQLSYTDIMRETKPLNYALSCGEVGCALSHINIYRRMAAESTPLALILEDDALIDSDTVDALNEIESLNINIPTVTLLTEGAKYINKPLHGSQEKKHAIYKVLEAACSHGYVVNHSAAKKLAEFLYPVWMVADKWQVLNEYSVCNVEVVIPPVIGKTAHADSSTIQIDEILKKRIDEEKDFMWAKIKNTRPLKLKLKRLIWSSFIYPFLKISK